MSEEGREERDGNLNFPHRSGTLGDQIATRPGPGARACGPRLGSVQPMGSRLGAAAGGGRHSPAIPTPAPGSQAVPVSSQRFSEEEEAPQRKRNICTEKRSRPADPPFSPPSFRLIIYPGPSAPGNFAPGHRARTLVRALPWDTGVELGPGRGRHAL